jgi:hypothetical protein
MNITSGHREAQVEVELFYSELFIQRAQTVPAKSFSGAVAKRRENAAKNGHSPDSSYRGILNSSWVFGRHVTIVLV